MLIALYAARTTASGISWNWTAIGTVALALATFAALGYTILATRRDRAQAARDRAEAEKNLREERAAGNGRLQAEQAHDADMRRRDRQIANAAALVARVAEIRSHMDGVPNAYLRASFSSLGGSPVARRLDEPETLAAIASLKHGAWAEAAMLGTGKAAEVAAGRYRRLADLVDDAASEGSSTQDRDIRSLKNYARWVLITLRMLAENETVPPFTEGARAYPSLGDEEVKRAWRPDPIPAQWESPEVDVPVPVGPWRIRSEGEPISSPADSPA
jgi:hypothetical protein